ncbi:MAG: ferredoxin [Candidatus Magasanikbacteria bacterium CG10_big_fil_rev_8_21_14_0_10_36_32]|uniref:Ferredoxin n=1 Tax=Candidatus Magasanikbacteria bacterium CG10_big_fil_rev_8_21_14_0_10_36_32 TaxID=1974646 RepID=A0A2M6W5H4_9BACT|nr:MAG: ferredoxin [Candidatus Magasanikbacteria bacterium CG10_big_fil_rev_8_21_14_0_10_36_32]
MIKKFIMTIDGQKIEAKEGETILQVALRNCIDIPHLCAHPDTKVKANCRMCVVKIKGVNGLQTACSTPVSEGMDVETLTPEIRWARKFNLELIFGQHVEDCSVCVLDSKCDLLKYRKIYNSKMLRFPDRKINYPIYQFGPIIFDQTKCIDCRNCVEVCPTGYLELKDRGSDINIEPSADKKKDCIACGQCLVHCPVGAIKSEGEFESVKEIKKILQQKDKTVVVQFAPAIRTSIGEELGLPYGLVVTDLLTAGLRKLGFHKVFDTSVAADFTTSEEAGQAVNHIKEGKNLPVFTSCCPSWVLFIEFNYPELIKNITTVRSPEIILGGLVKSYWAEKEKIDPKKIVMVSVMPCTSKKIEIERKEMFIKGNKPVDIVLTTRELAWMLKDEKIDLEALKPELADNPFGDPSGAGVIYGASGGVMESALRTAYYRLTGENLKSVDFKEVRGQEGIKRAVIKLCKPVKTNSGECIEIKAAVVNEIKNARIILDELKKDPKKYDFVEVMACPGGCVGGGGQSLPTNSFIRSKRAASLYTIDKNKKIRLAHENPAVIKAYQEYFNDEKICKEVFHTSFHQQKKKPIGRLKRDMKDFKLIKK